MCGSYNTHVFYWYSGWRRKIGAYVRNELYSELIDKLFECSEYSEPIGWTLGKLFGGTYETENSSCF